MKSMSVLLLLVVMVGCTSAAPSLKGWLKQTEELVLSMLQESESYENQRAVKKNDAPIPEVVKAMGATEFLKYLNKADLLKELEGPGPFTVFVPSNAAFEGLKNCTKNLLNNQSSLERIIKFNIIKGQLKPSAIKNDLKRTTLLDGEGSIRMNVYKDGKIHTAAGRVISSSPRAASNGLVYAAQGLPQPPVACIAKSLSQCPLFTNLTHAIQSAGMYDMLCGRGPFTLFAPSDAAFQNIPEDTRNRLLGNATALHSLLKYLTVQGTFYTPAFRNNDTVPTLSGMNLNIQQENGKFLVNKVPITHPDTTTVNGVVHTVGDVLMPPTAHLEMVLMQR